MMILSNIWSKTADKRYENSSKQCNMPDKSLEFGCLGIWMVKSIKIVSQHLKTSVLTKQECFCQRSCMCVYLVCVHNFYMKFETYIFVFITTKMQKCHPIMYNIPTYYL